MSINFATLAPIVATVATAGGLIFQIGTHSEKLGSLGLKVNALELAKSRDNHYFKPPFYLLQEPENTVGRTKNLQQRNVNGFTGYKTSCSLINRFHIRCRINQNAKRTATR